jgi:hypothetical protein
LTEEMFNIGYTSVLTGKLNQDPLEVKFKWFKIILILMFTLFFLCVFSE